ncbi:hypothetical protein MNEG_3480 [Monoraphidium neglectum]|uniref:Patatin n=1 Tax=Monoraphidium neglectum TaxID=145388 RepID=A0A0D2LCJ9_9CHLO|nr:hypothetical protein MNEG_3480 [Monoraphidium neglectum]KIZ04479.1 hypothetical protein MNEG_3480 [Monoraphidium neglectum]|eukprot:XP_013903498.1 hypothetical protein MNEG_3480 [Monoraphidium neglectum]
MSANDAAIIKPADLASSNTYKTLLSLDGGGLRGLVSCQVLQALEDSIRKLIWQERRRLFPTATSAAPGAVHLDDAADLVTGGGAVVKSEDDIAVDLGDWFHLVAGTSTGGLLALYFSARGGRKDYSGVRRGSAAAAAKIYTVEGAKYQHGSAGLEGVLKEIFASDSQSTMQTALKTPVAITAVDASKARSGLFYYENVRNPLKDPSKPFETSGFTSPLRRSTIRGKALARVQSRALTRREAETVIAASLGLGGLDLVDVAAARRGVDGQGHKLWLPSVQLSQHDFYVWQVARATSAAPGFLPPVEVSPSDGTGEAGGSWPRIFVDGGLANNDPAWMGVGLMLMLWGARRQAQNEAHNNGRLPGAMPKSLTFLNTAVFSVGTGQSQACGAWQDSPGGGNPITGLKAALGLLANLVSLTMAVNGEDKQSILKLIYYGLLRLPEGQYMRIQLPFGDTAAPAPPIAPAAIAEAPAPAAAGPDAGPPDAVRGGGTRDAGDAPAAKLGAAKGEAEVTGDDDDFLPPVELTPEELAALDKMDDPDPRVLAKYEEVGQKLVARYEKRIDWWVRCFLLGLEDPFDATARVA